MGNIQQYGNDVPLANLFVTIQKSVGVKSESFADSTGNLDKFVAQR